ncbi:MAG TPA: TPM domain-containing protein [Sphingobium sp.]|nr:TPM domain-containing protein [Sphingobium sp.]
MPVRFSQADHAQVTAAVAAAEKDSDGEIVTIIAQRSDSYHDAGLHWAIGAVFLTLSLAAAFPAHFRALCSVLLQSWEHELEDWKLLTLLLGLLILKFLVVRYALAWMPLRMALTPRATKTRRVHRRAVSLFRAVAQGRTQASTGILIYLSLDEHRAEILADAAIDAKVTPEVWGDAMAALIDAVRDGRPAEGMAEAVRQVGVILTQHFPRTGANPNELPDRLIEL